MCIKQHHNCRGVWKFKTLIFLRLLHCYLFLKMKKKKTDKKKTGTIALSVRIWSFKKKESNQFLAIGFLCLERRHLFH